MELTAIITGLLLATGAAVVAGGLVARAWLWAHPELPENATRLASEWVRWLARRAGYRGRIRIGRLGPGDYALVLTLVLGLATVTLASVGVGALIDNVTEGDGVAVLDHPVARFVGAHRAAALTPVMKAVSTVGGPAGMALIALGVGVLLTVVRRSWMPVAVLAVTAGGVSALTTVFKAILGRSRPPAAQALAAANGFGFPSGHAAAAAAVCGAVAWLCGLWLRSWRGRIALWAAAAMLAALVGISRVYLGVHWASDVIGGWAFGILWLAVVVSGWTAFGRLPKRG